MLETEVLARLGDAAEEDGRLDDARGLFERGASFGDTICLTRLAYMYDVGVGVAVDKKLAMKLYRKAWRIDRSTTATNNIAILYRELERNRLMFSWFERAAHAGDGGAHLDVAKCYLSGDGVRKNGEAAVRSLSAAVNSIYISEDEREEAAALLSSLAPRLV